MKTSSRPEVVRCFFAEAFRPALSAVELEWDVDAVGHVDRLWHLPAGLKLQGPPPTRFGMAIHRRGEDQYQLRVLWNELSLAWDNLARHQIMASSVAPLMAMLGTDLWRLLMQPVASEPAPTLVA